jgi:N-methylhydantoinase B
MVGAIGAFSFRDGIATGGQVRSPICRIGNVEHNEQSFPLLILHRKENTDSGGAGKFRGGNSASVAFIPHGTTHITQDTESSGAAIPTAPGLAGGYPANTNYYRFKRNTDVLQRFARQRLPDGIDEVEGQEELLQLRQIDIHQGPSDVYEVAFAAGAGYGDPLERDPEAVRKDVYLEDISPRAAREIFRVVLIGEGEDLRVDAAATAELRHRALIDRLGREPRPYAGPRLPVMKHITEHLHLVQRNDAHWLTCSRCGQPLSPASENYKLHCHRIVHPIQAASTLIGEPRRFIDEAVQFRQFCCPACGGLIENEVCRASDDVLRDIELTS